MSSLYTSIIQAKNGTFIPVLKSGKTIESKYDPDKDINRQISLLEKQYKYYIIFGMGSGLLASKLLRTDCKILIVDFNNDSLNFLFDNLDSLEELKSNNNIYISNIDNFEDVLVKTYLPALHGDLKIIEQHNWCEEIGDKYNIVKKRINNAFEKISADFSVQSHFGKIWQNNILNNIKLNNPQNITENTNKSVAAIIAAGPSLDSTIYILKNTDKDYFIISTDTAYSSLIRNSIIPDAVISLDGQHISHTHFLHNHKFMKDTFFYFDICGNFSAVNKLNKHKINYTFFRTGHPLAEFINEAFELNISYLCSGSGTVTIAGVNLAFMLGFKNIEVFGADFSYINNKPYAKGTYLDDNFNITSNKLCSSEKQFSRLMYRTELIDLMNNRKTTQILNSYKTSFEFFLNTNRINFYLKDNIYYLSNENSENKKVMSNVLPDYKKIYQYIKENTNEMMFLPYYAWLRHYLKIESLNNLENIAYTSLVRYN